MTSTLYNHITCLPYKNVYSSFVEYIVNLGICVISFTTMYLKQWCLFWRVCFPVRQLNPFIYKSKIKISTAIYFEYFVWKRQTFTSINIIQFKEERNSFLATKYFFKLQAALFRKSVILHLLHNVVFFVLSLKTNNFITTRKRGHYFIGCYITIYKTLYIPGCRWYSFQMLYVKCVFSLSCFPFI